MVEHGVKGSIVNISSIVGRTGNLGQANYAASKAGVMGLSATAAKELAKFVSHHISSFPVTDNETAVFIFCFVRHGIRVNSVLPGFISTRMTEAVPDKIKERLLKAIPLNRFGEPEGTYFTNFSTGFV